MPRGATVTLTGTVTPAHAGQTVHRQAYVDGAWWTWATSPLSSTGTYRFTTSTARTYTYRILKSADAGNARAISPRLSLTVY